MSEDHRSQSIRIGNEKTWKPRVSFSREYWPKLLQKDGAPVSPNDWSFSKSGARVPGPMQSKKAPDSLETLPPFGGSLPGGAPTHAPCPRAHWRGRRARAQDPMGPRTRKTWPRGGSRF